jgi:hypothetical protein
MHSNNSNSDNTVNNFDNVNNVNLANVAYPADFLEEFKAIQAESLGWTPLAPGVYLHCAAHADVGQVAVVQVVGQADASMADSHVLWLVF